MTTQATTAPIGHTPMSALRRLVDLHDLAPVTVRKPLDLTGDDPIVVEVYSVNALEAFADAVEKPVVSADGATFTVAHEVEGVPALFTAGGE